VGWWQVSADTLAGSRFVISPLAEATASLLALHRAAAAHPGERAWLDAYLPAYRQLLASDPVTAQLVEAALAPRWIADFFTWAPTGEGEATFAGELEHIRRTPPEAALADLANAARTRVPGALHGSARALAGGLLPDALRHRSDLPDRAAGLIEWVWTRTVLPTWPRRRRIIEADVVARTTRLGRSGWAAALAGMRPGMRWLGEGRLQINAYDYPPRDISGARLLFVPVTTQQGWASWDLPGRYALIYPASGALAEAGRRPVPQSLSLLLGPGRAEVLALLDTPKSTTQLVALTGQRLGSTGRHLRVLLDAGLLGRRRSGRSVLYFRTAAGDMLIGAASPAGTSPQPRPGSVPLP
jgi:DNA-binding transcriptional ArsR family regulator